MTLREYRVTNLLLGGFVVFLVIGMFLLCLAEGADMAVGETLRWDEAQGADSYNVSWFPSANPSDVSSISGIYENKYQFQEDNFIPNTQYIIHVSSVDCCGVESDHSTITFYRKVGTGGDCCHKSMVKDTDSECWVAVEGMSYFRPGGVINDAGCP